MKLRRLKRRYYAMVGNTEMLTFNYVCAPENRAALIRVLLNTPNILREVLRLDPLR